MLSPIEFEILSGSVGLQDLREAWIALEATCTHRAFYTDWRWHKAVSTHLSLDPVYYLCLRRGKTVVGIMPLHVTHLKHWGLSVPALTFPTHAHITLSDILIRETEKADDLLPKAMAYLVSQVRWPWLCMRFRGVAEGTNFLSASPVDGLEVDSYGASAFFETRGKTIISIPSQLFRNILRLRRKAEAAYGEVRTTTVMGGSELMDAYSAFLAVEAAGWKGRKGTAIRNNPTLIQFYRDLLWSFSTTGDAAIHLLWFGDRVAAASFCLRAGRVWSVLKIGYDEFFGEFGPGNNLLKDVLAQACCDSDVDEINLVSSPLWAERWHPKTRKVYKVSVYRNCLPGLFVKMIAKFYQKFAI